ncbi:MAG TPA: TlpA disulfide reductase family protein [Pyrinomonadaceae bacterium]|jgi:thiol-disulfide isomerase/thioredoxin|nr:TlpA disulfide reductase family protein [Pyrinomonadaceae bacterium]
MFKNLSRAAVVFAIAAASQTVFAQSNTNTQAVKPNATQSQPAAQAPAKTSRPTAETTTQVPAQQKTQTPAQTAAPAPTPAPQGGTMLVHSEGHEYAPLLELKIDYKDWTFNRLSDGTPVSLRELAKDKKLVMVVYFAPWCGNWRAEAPVALKLYEKYKAQGFEIVGVSEYGSAEDSRKYFAGLGGATFPVVVESEATDAREKTTHFGYRQAAGDPRRWGSPFNVFLEPAKLNKSGELLTEKAWVVGGELIEKDAEQFIRERLGITAQAAVEQCKDEPKTEAKKQ